jgi:hypothetical protein
MELAQSLSVLATALRKFEDAKVGTHTAHNAVCKAVWIELYPGGTVNGKLDKNNLSGTIFLNGCRTDLPFWMAAIFSDDTTNQVSFSNIDELLELLLTDADKK